MRTAAISLLLLLLAFAGCVTFTTGMWAEDQERLGKEMVCARLSRCSGIDFEVCRDMALWPDYPPVGNGPAGDRCLRILAEAECSETDYVGDACGGVVVSVERKLLRALTSK